MPCGCDAARQRDQKPRRRRELLSSTLIDASSRLTTQIGAVAGLRQRRRMAADTHLTHLLQADGVDDGDGVVVRIHVPDLCAGAVQDDG